MIPLRDIEISRPVTSQTRHMMIRKNNLLIEIVFTDEQKNKKSIRLDLDEKYISLLQEQIDVFKDQKNNPSVKRAIAVAENPKLCVQCAENKHVLLFHSDYNLCLDCFTYNYGKALLEAPKAEYFGGHKAYLGGGALSKHQTGRLFLTEHYLIFSQEDKDPAKRWEIVIPLDSVIMRRWHIEEVARRQNISGGGTSMDNFAFGGGTIHDSGTAHHLVVPYIDENGIPQEPRFGISSFRGKAIKEWAAKIYQQVVKEKNNTPQVNVGTGSSSQHTQSNNDPIRVLKMRFAKGEISREEYEEMRKMLDS